jgi:hypothetical protein
MRTFRRGGAFARVGVAASLVVSFATRAEAADLPGARLRLSRSAEAQACATEAVLAQELASRMTASGDHAPELLVFDVEIRRDQDAYEATIRAQGRKEGVRSLRASGPSCDPMHDALVVTLLLLLDRDPMRPSSSQPAPELAPALRPTEVIPLTGPSVPSPATGATREQFTLWGSLGLAATHGLPEAWSGAAMGNLAMRFARWELGLGGFWAPERTIRSTPGSLAARVFGVRARGCYGFETRSASMRWAGCAVVALGSLRGEGQGFTSNGSRVRPWFLAGAEADFELSLSSRVRFGFFGAALGSAHTESFSIGAVGVPYRTDRVVGWAGSELRVRIW